MELLQGITKRKNRSKLYLLIITFCLLFFSSYIYYNINLNENQNTLFNKLSELNLTNNNPTLPTISNLLNSDIYNDKCISAEKVISCEKINYDNLWFFGKYNLEISNINDKITYKIIENNKNWFIKIIEYLLSISISLFLTYYFLNLFYFIKNKFNPYLKDEYELLREEWEKIQRSKIELEEMLSQGDKSVKEKLEELKEKERKLEEEYKKAKERKKDEFSDIKDDWKENKEFSINERKKIYKKLSKYYHPDAGNVVGDDDFKNINEAYTNKEDNILFDYYNEYIEIINEEEGIFNKQSVTESMVLVQVVNLGLYPKPQHKISRMHVDFAFVKEKLIIEIDGPHHDTLEQKETDRKRDSFLNKNGWIVKRYPVRERLTPETAMKIARKIKRELIKIKT